MRGRRFAKSECRCSEAFDAACSCGFTKDCRLKVGDFSDVKPSWITQLCLCSVFHLTD